MPEKKMIEIIQSIGTKPMGITSSPSTTLDITIDITEDAKHNRALGQMVYVVLKEDGQNILVIGQIISIETKNRWHEDASFKGVIKRHGSLPHLSGTADNRIATISVQACYVIGDDDAESHILGTSPSTGEKVQKMTNEVMKTIMKHHEAHITYIGRVYGTDVDLPFWFKHFGKTSQDTKELGANDAYHIGVFGKTGSGKTVTASYMLLGYAKNKGSMNILVLDPQGQFYNDTELLPDNIKLQDRIEAIGMKYNKYRILEDIFLPSKQYLLFALLLQKSGFIKKAFNILSDREMFAAEAIALYLENRNTKSKEKDANLNKLSDDAVNLDLMKKTLKKFTETEDTAEEEAETKKKKGKSGYNKYIDMIYSQGARKDQLIEKIEAVLSNDSLLEEIFASCWKPVTSLFCDEKPDKSKKKAMKEIIGMVTDVDKKGRFVILDLSEKKGSAVKENLQAMFVKMIESEIKAVGETYYEQGKKVNCLVVMDEAHRFISRESADTQIAELTSEIIDSVRTTRKYGIGYMFITQTIESLDREIIQQMRIFAFGYGLTAGLELRRISELINNESAIKLYRSFIDPASNNKYPFMFFGPISPLSFTGSPLFIEVYSDVKKFK